MAYNHGVNTPNLQLKFTSTVKFTYMNETNSMQITRKITFLYVIHTDLVLNQLLFEVSLPNPERINFYLRISMTCHVLEEPRDVHFK